ncbi:hypothetical protein [Leifsonia sp. NPDC058248]
MIEFIAAHLWDIEEALILMAAGAVLGLVVNLRGRHQRKQL